MHVCLTRNDASIVRTSREHDRPAMNDVLRKVLLQIVVDNVGPMCSQCLSSCLNLNSLYNDSRSDLLHASM